MIRIVSNGAALGTKVYADDGQEIKGVSRIEILPVTPNGLVQARITLVNVALDVQAANIKRKALPPIPDPQPVR